MTNTTKSDVIPHAVANIWMDGKEVHGTFSRSRKVKSFNNVNEWKEEKRWEEVVRHLQWQQVKLLPGLS